MSDNDPLRDLGQRIQSAKQSYEVEPKVEDHHSGVQHAWRMVIELVSGMAIGFGLGYGLDVLFGTLPIFMIVFIWFFYKKVYPPATFSIKLKFYYI